MVYRHGTLGDRNSHRTSCDSVLRFTSSDSDSSLIVGARRSALFRGKEWCEFAKKLLGDVDQLSGKE